MVDFVGSTVVPAGSKVVLAGAGAGVGSTLHGVVELQLLSGLWAALERYLECYQVGCHGNIPLTFR